MTRPDVKSNLNEGTDLNPLDRDPVLLFAGLKDAIGWKEFRSTDHRAEWLTGRMMLMCDALAVFFDAFEDRLASLERDPRPAPPPDYTVGSDESRLLVLLLHQVNRSHDFAPDGCSGCSDAKNWIDERVNGGPR